MKIETISKQDFYNYYDQPEMTKDPKYRLPKIFEKGQDFIKVFYKKSGWISSNLYRPYAIRFYQNAKRLQSLGFQAPEVKEIKHCPELNLHLVQYAKVTGEDALKLAQEGNVELLYKATAFIASLHAKGIFFRSLHLSNLLYQSENRFGLIDVSDVRFSKSSLPFYLIYRNLRHAFQHRDDKHFWRQMNIKDFFQIYFDVLKPSYFSRLMLRCLLKHT